MFHETLYSTGTLFLLAFVSAVASSLLFTLVVRSLARRFNWMRGPSSARHVHTTPTPRLGGVAIYLTVAGSLCAARLLLGSRWVGHESLHILWRVLFPASMLFLVGLIDDWKPLPAKLKLACQIASGLWLYLLGYSVAGASHWIPGAHSTQLMGAVATVIWVVWITNAVNLIDGLDGLAAGSALLSVLTLFVAALVHGNHAAAVGAVLLGGAMLGFLRYNFNPATIFLGDGGSLFIGFMLSALGLIGTSQTKTPLVIAVGLPTLAFGLPLTEVVLSVTRRFLSGRRLFEPDRMHIHHRLLALGLNHRRVVIVLYGVSAAFGSLALLLVYPTWIHLGVSLTALTVLGAAGIMKLRYPEFAEVAKLTHRTLQQRRVIANTLVIQQAVEQLRAASTFHDIRRALEGGFPSECFQEMRFGLAPAHGGNTSDLFGPGSSAGTQFVVRSDKTAPAQPLHTARLVMDLVSPAYCGSLEFIVNDCRGDILLNLNNLFSQLHPVLNEAIGRLTPALSREQRSSEVSVALPFALTTPTLAGLRYANQ